MANAFTSLIEGLSARLNVQLEVQDESSVHVNFDGLALLAEYLPEAGQVILAVPVAPAPARDREAVFLEILKGQYLFAETQGATLALDPGGSFISLQVAPSIHTLTRENFPTLVENFLNVAETWRRRLEAERPGDPAPAPAAPDLMAGFGKV